LLWVILEPYTSFWYLNIRMPAGIPDLSLSRLAVASLCVVWIAQLAIRRKRLQRLGFVEMFMVLLCVMVMPSVVAGLSGLSRNMQVLFDKFIIPFLVFVLAKNLYEEKTALDKLTAALTVIEAHLCFLLFYEHITGRPLFYVLGRQTIYTRSLRKIVGLLGNGAFLATVLAMIAPIALYRFVRARSPYARAFYGTMFALAVIGNFFCYNRGAWLAMAVSLLVMLLFQREYRRVLLPLVLIAAVVGVVYWQSISRSAVVVERLSNVSGIRFRVTMLEASKKMIRTHPLFGVGFGDFATYFIQYGGHWELLAWDNPTPHNTYLLVLTTMGLVSFVPYVLIFLSMVLEMGIMLRRSERERGADSALLVSGWAAIAAYAVSAGTLDLYVSTFTSLVLFCITGTIMGYVSHLRSSPPRLQPERA
jgi:O-antigen ligase